MPPASSSTVWLVLRARAADVAGSDAAVSDAGVFGRAAGHGPDVRGHRRCRVRSARPGVIHFSEIRSGGWDGALAPGQQWSASRKRDVVLWPMARDSSTIRLRAHGTSLRRRSVQFADRSVAARAPGGLARGVPGCGARDRRIHEWRGDGNPGGRRGRRKSGTERSDRARYRGVVGSRRRHVSSLAAGGGTSRGTRWRRAGRGARDLRASSW